MLSYTRAAIQKFATIKAASSGPKKLCSLIVNSPTSSLYFFFAGDKMTTSRVKVSLVKPRPILCAIMILYAIAPAPEAAAAAAAAAATNFTCTSCRVNNASSKQMSPQHRPLSRQVSLASLWLPYTFNFFSSNSNTINSSNNTTTTSTTTTNNNNNDFNQRQAEQEQHEHNVCYARYNNVIGETRNLSISNSSSVKAARSLSSMGSIFERIYSSVLEWSYSERSSSSSPLRIKPVLPCGLNRAILDGTHFANESASDTTNGIGRYSVEWEQFPFVVFINNKGRDHKYCSGAIVSDRHILTAATCVTDCQGERTIKSEARQLTGTLKSKRFCLSGYNLPDQPPPSKIKFSKVFIQAKYDKCKHSSRHDLTILETTEPIRMRLQGAESSFENQSVNKVCLPSQTLLPSFPHMALAIGWSGDYLKELISIDLEVKTGLNCPANAESIRGRVLCSDGSRIPCKFLYGAPVIKTNRLGAMELVGIYSNHLNSCGTLDNVALATNVGYNLDWIQSILTKRMELT